MRFGGVENVPWSVPFKISFEGLRKWDWSQVWSVPVSAKENDRTWTNGGVRNCITSGGVQNHFRGGALWFGTPPPSPLLNPFFVDFPTEERIYLIRLFFGGGGAFCSYAFLGKLTQRPNSVNVRGNSDPTEVPPLSQDRCSKTPFALCFL